MMFNRGFGGLEGCFENGLNQMHGRPGMFMMGGMILFTVLIVVIIVALVKRSRTKHDNDEASELLNARFAKGEITEEEYTRMKTVLKHK